MIDWHDKRHRDQGLAAAQTRLQQLTHADWWDEDALQRVAYQRILRDAVRECLWWAGRLRPS